MTACSHADITMKTDKVEFVEFYLSGTEADEPILIDWGDGSVNEYAGGGKIEHKYAVQESYVIKITGKIRLLDCYNTRSYDCKLLSLDASGNTTLKVLKCDGTGVNSLNVANCTSLYELRCGSNNFTSLDIRRNPKLRHVHCSDNNLSASALNQIYENLPKPPAPYSAQDPLGLSTMVGSYTLDIRNNPGTVASNRDIAKNKGWEVWGYER